MRRVLPLALVSVVLAGCSSDKEFQTLEVTADDWLSVAAHGDG